MERLVVAWRGSECGSDAWRHLQRGIRKLLEVMGMYVHYLDGGASFMHVYMWQNCSL